MRQREDQSLSHGARGRSLRQARGCASRWAARFLLGMAWAAFWETFPIVVDEREKKRSVRKEGKRRIAEFSRLKKKLSASRG